MSSKVLLPIVAVVVLSLSSLGCAGEVVVRTAPPADRVEVVTAAPSPQHFWIRGHWQWNGHQHVWEPGRWEIRREGAVWQAGSWRAEGGGWAWHDGRWVNR